jgi:hypothetical protein
MDSRCHGNDMPHIICQLVAEALLAGGCFHVPAFCIRLCSADNFITSGNHRAAEQNATTGYTAPGSLPNTLPANANAPPTTPFENR